MAATRPQTAMATGTDDALSPAGAGAALTSTPCPHCRSDVPVEGERTTCPGCGEPLRFVEVPDRPCDDCGAPVPLDGQDVVRCPACGLAQPADPGRPAVHQTTCVRCRRRLDIESGAREVTCRHCGQRLRLLDTV